MPKPRYQNPTVKQNKNGSYYIRVWEDYFDAEGNLARRQRTITLGGAEIGKREAVARKNEEVSRINKGAYVVQSSVSMREFLVVYRDQHVSRLSKSTQEKYESHLKNHIEPAFADLKLCDITTLLLSSWLQIKEKVPMGYHTRQDLRNIVSSIFTQAADWGYWKDRNPADRAKLGAKNGIREKRKLTDDQTRRLLAALPWKVRLMCCTGLFCTLRISEILGLREKHLDFERGLILVRERFYRGDVATTKTPKSLRDIPMGYLADDLKRLCEGDPERFVFTIETHPEWGRKLGLCRDDRDLLQHFLRPAAKELGFYWPGFGWHALRREAVTALTSVIGIGLTMGMAGHATPSMSMAYTLEDQTQRVRGVEAFQERILGKPEGGVQ